MTPEFDHTRQAFATSVIGRAAAALGATARSAWKASRIGRALRSMKESLAATSLPARIRAMAIIVLVAAAMQPVLILAMPATVAPALPWPAFVLVAMFAAVAASQAEAFAAAWPASRLARWLRA